jgi:hypothetical protein
MTRPSSFIPYSHGGQTARTTARTAKGVADYLQAHDKMRLLLPAAGRHAALQKACEAALPVLFDTCSVLHLDAGQLTIAAPNGALAAKLKQKLPMLQGILQQQGWQVSAIRLKVQAGKTVEKSSISKRLFLSDQALSALASLENALEPSSRNAALREALQTMVRRHRHRE